jgi:hypothetical protein
VHVDEEDPRPAQCGGQDTAEQDAGNRAEGADPAPGAEGGVSFFPLGEGRGQDRERGRSDQRRTEPLQSARADQGALAPPARLSAGVRTGNMSDTSYRPLL